MISDIVGKLKSFFGLGKPEIMSHEPEKPGRPPQPSITCPVCGKTSYHPDDIAQKYCGFCKWWTGDTERLAQWIEYHAIERPVSDRQPFHPAVLDAIVLMLRR